MWKDYEANKKDYGSLDSEGNDGLFGNEGTDEVVIIKKASQ